MNIFADFSDRIRKSIEALGLQTQVGGKLDLSRITVEPPRDASHGDLATNAAMVLARPAGMKPRDIAEAVLYRNYAEALDAPSEERLKQLRGLPLMTKVFGSAENRTKVWAELRDASREIVSSRLVRELIFNPIKPASAGN